MRLVELVPVAVFLGGGVALVRGAWRAAVAARHADDRRWEPWHRDEGGTRRIYLRRGEELEPVGEVSPSDPDYDAAFPAVDGHRPRARGHAQQRALR